MNKALIKQASKAARRLADLIRQGKIKYVDKRMLSSVLSQEPSRYVPTAREAVRYAKNKGIPAQQALHELQAGQDTRSKAVSELLGRFFGNNDKIMPNADVLQILEGGRNQKAINELFKQQVVPGKQRVRQHIRNVIAEQTDGVPLSLDDLRASGTAFKGGERPRITGKDWEISSPGFVTTHPDLARDYAIRPDLSQYLEMNGRIVDSGRVTTGTGGVISVSDLDKSKTFKRGKTFPTGHLQLTNRRARILNTTPDAYNNYEIVLPGHEMLNMPWRSYASFDISPRLGPKKYRFYRLKSPETYRPDHEPFWDLEHAYRSFLTDTKPLRGKSSLKVLEDLLGNFRRGVQYVPAKPAAPSDAASAGLAGSSAGRFSPGALPLPKEVPENLTITGIQSRLSKLLKNRRKDLLARTKDLQFALKARKDLSSGLGKLIHRKKIRELDERIRNLRSGLDSMRKIIRNLESLEDRSYSYRPESLSRERWGALSASLNSQYEDSADVISKILELANA